MSSIPEPPALVLVSRHVGLANRLRALIGYAAAGRVLRRRFMLCWVNDDGCDAEFGELFEPAAFPLVTLEEVERGRASGEMEVWDVASWFHGVWRQLAPDVAWTVFLEAVADALSRLRPAPAIRDAVDEFRRAHRLDECLGLHIRHTDNVELHEIRAKLDPGFDLASISTLEGFEEVARTEGGGTARIFLATDNPAVERSFQDAFGARLVTSPKRFRQEWNYSGDIATNPPHLLPRLTPAADGLIDLLLLAGCRGIVGTYYSSFSEFAALWGRVDDYREVRGRITARNALIDTTIAELRALPAVTCNDMREPDAHVEAPVASVAPMEARCAR